MRKITAFLIALLLMFSTLCVSAAQIYYDGEWHTYKGNIFTLLVDDKKINCEVPPIVFDDYSVVPARDVFEAMGAIVSWTQETQKVTVIYDDTRVEVYINNNTAKVNGEEKTAPIPPKLINGKTMIPVRFVAEALGFDVNFDASTDTISIKTNKETNTQTKPEITNPASPTPTYDIRLTDYTYSKDDDVVSIVLKFDKSVKYSHFLLKEPSRLVIDTENTQFPTTLKSAQTGYDDVTGIRLGQQTKGVRIVIDLATELDYKISCSGKKMTVKLGQDLKSDSSDTEENNDEETEEPETVVIPDPPTYAPSRRVYLDPGHGGADPGATYTDEDGTIWRESEINLAVALKVQKILEKENVEVIMSRESDKTVELVDRPNDANKKEATLFVSIHTNSFFTDTAYGIETWGALEYSATYCGITDKKLADNIQKAVIKETKGFDRGVKDSTTLAVLRHSVMPSVLIEVGFISNTEEREKMFEDSYRDKLAEGIAEGILKTLTEMGL